MLDLAIRSPAPSHVTARFSDGSHTFFLPQGSTLGELAERIRDLETFCGGNPISIQVDFETPLSRSLTTKSTPHN